MQNLLKSKFFWAVVFVVIIAAENHYQPNFFVKSLQWVVWLMPYAWQDTGVLLMAATTTLVIALFVWMFGWISVLGLALVALWPLTSLHFGELDYWFYDLAQKWAANPRDFQQVSQIFNWLHYGFVIVVALFVVVLITNMVRPRPRRRYEPKFK